jgi:glycosyltransferase involved in cell wall biosynthesis
MDLYALSSHREGLPNVLLEAMAMEVPVVSTRINGVPRLIEDGVNGSLVAAGSVDELALGVRRLLNDGTLRQRYAAAGRRTVEERFSFAERMRKLRAIYDGMLGEKFT